MLNYLWAGMTLTGILWGALHGQMTAVTDGAIQASKEAVTLCITMLGVMTLWTGVLEIGQFIDTCRAPLRTGGPAGKKNGTGTHLPFSKAGPGWGGKETDKRQYDCQHTGPGMGCNAGRLKSHGRAEKGGGGTRDGRCGQAGGDCQQ